MPRHTKTSNLSPVYHSLRLGTMSPKGKKLLLLKSNIALKSQRPHWVLSPLPFREGRGDRSTRHADQSTQPG